MFPLATLIMNQSNPFLDTVFFVHTKATFKKYSIEDFYSKYKRKKKRDMLQSKHAGNKFIHFVRDAMVHIIFDDTLEKIANASVLLYTY